MKRKPAPYTHLIMLQLRVLVYLSNITICIYIYLFFMIQHYFNINYWLIQHFCW